MDVVSYVLQTLFPSWCPNTTCVRYHPKVQHTVPIILLTRDYDIRNPQINLTKGRILFFKDWWDHFGWYCLVQLVVLDVFFDILSKKCPLKKYGCCFLRTTDSISKLVPQYGVFIYDCVQLSDQIEPSWIRLNRVESGWTYQNTLHGAEPMLNSYY